MTLPATTVLLHTEKIRELLTEMEQRPDDAHHVLKYAVLIRVELIALTKEPASS
jgi:hypothetical protein